MSFAQRAGTAERALFKNRLCLHTETRSWLSDRALAAGVNGLGQASGMRGEGPGAHALSSLQDGEPEPGPQE